MRDTHSSVQLLLARLDDLLSSVSTAPHVESCPTVFLDFPHAFVFVLDRLDLNLLGILYVLADVILLGCLYFRS